MPGFVALTSVQWGASEEGTVGSEASATVQDNGAQ